MLVGIRRLLRVLYSTLRTLSNIGYMSGTLWCVSLEGGVLPLGHVCQWTVRERLLLLSLQPPVAPRHGHSCGGHCPGSLQHSRQPPGTEINISSPHPCNQGKRLNSIKGAVMRFWESIFIFSNCQLQQKLKLSISLSGPNTGSQQRQGPALGNLNAESN